MNPFDFVAKWRASPKREHIDSQPHFLDLCRLIDVEDPATADPAHTWFTFEKGASKTSGGQGWADVWRRGCFGWEYKSYGVKLDDAFRQLLNYSVALENPPLLITSDMDRIVIHTNWTNTVQEVTTLTIDDLLDGAKRDRLRAAFTDPERLKPQKTRQALTEEAAARFVALAQRLRERGHDPGTVAHFVNRLVFCMFAEDVGLLPNSLFLEMLEASRPAPAEFADNARRLFAAMKDGGKIDFKRIDWFNGGLFDDDTTLPLDRADISDLLDAARLDWSSIDPSILGTLFERGLDPAKRSQLGAHYTDRDKIMKIVTPVIVEPLLAEWAEVRGAIESKLAKAPKATKERLLRGPELAARTKALNESTDLLRAFLERLKRFRVLDPACGSGNFLYLALRALKDIEHRVNVEAEALGLPRSFPAVGPEAVRGIEINPYAAELARVSVWIGEIQWMRLNGYDAGRNPILRPLDTIECRDAILNPDGTRADWPEADVVIGNPPFLGGRGMKGELGAHYVEILRKAYHLPGSANFVLWFERAGELLEARRIARFGLVASKEAFGGAGLHVIRRLYHSCEIYWAESNIVWPAKDTSVRVNITAWCRRGETAERRLNGEEVETIHPNVRSGATDVTGAFILRSNKNTSFIGVQPSGPFDVPGDLARQWLRAPINPNGRHNSDVIRPYWNNYDVIRPSRDVWTIDFGLLAIGEACLYEAVFGYAEKVIRPARLANSSTDAKTRGWLETHWHQYWRPRPEVKTACSRLSICIVTPFSSKHRLFVTMAITVVASNNLVVIARDDYTHLGLLESRFHFVWSLARNMDLGKGGTPRYPPTMTYETFPFPEGLTPGIPASAYAGDPRAQAIATAAADLNAKRETWLNPPDLVRREPEVVPGYPDRILPVNDKAAEVLKKRTLTNLYNQRPAWLDNAHRALDEAVAEAYDWGDDWRSGALGDQEILTRLFGLNQSRISN